MTVSRAVLVLAAVLIASMVLAVGIGPTWIAPSTVWQIVIDTVIGNVIPDKSIADAAIIRQLRFPRVILAALVGAGLGVVGTTLQAVSGAILGPFSLPLAAFGGAILALALVMGTAHQRGALLSERLILSGVAVSFVLMAATNFLIFFGDRRGAAAAMFWMLGGLGAARWDLLAVPAIVLVLGLAFLLSQARRMNAVMIGDEIATTLGIEVSRFRFVLFVACALITGTMVAVSGAIGFVGLMIPHVFRHVVGADHRLLLPSAALGGAIFLVWVDVCARTVLAPEDLPIGIFTAAIGGAFFLWQMQRTHRGL
jgi:iron complex transport system permease protein